MVNLPFQIRNYPYLIGFSAVAGFAVLGMGFAKFASQGVDLPYAQITPQIISLDLPARNPSSSPVEVDRPGGLILADLNEDGKQDFLVTKPDHIVAYTYTGEQLWTKSTNIQLTGKSESQGLPGLHGAGVQAGDVDGDGKTEVLFLTKNNTLQIVQGQNGQSKAEIQLPPPPENNGWEHLVIANFRGQGDRDLLLQTTNPEGYRMGRYLAAYPLDELIAQPTTPPLWTRDDFLPNAHNGAKVVDLDGDGKDEVLGGTIIAPDGKVLFKLPIELKRSPHLDALFVADVRPDIPGLEVVALEEGGANRIFLYNRDRLIWSVNYQRQEPQNAVLGDFDPQRPGLEIWCRSRHNENQKPFVFDAQGELISTYEMKKVAPKDWTNSGVEEIFTIDWTGETQQLAAAKERHKFGDIGIFDPVSGAFVKRFANQADRIYVADVSGDWREEVIVLNGNQLYIYSNSELNPRPNQPELWTQQHYRRSKMTWNYYSP